MKFSLPTCMLTIVCVTAIAGTSRAKQMDPAKIPQEAKWVVHIDHDALSETQLMKLVRDQQSEKINEIRAWMESKLGVDPKQELHSVTLFGESYDRHQGAGIVCAKFDRKKVEEQFSSKVDVKKTESQDCTFYTWDVEKNMMQEHRKSGRAESNKEAAGKEGIYADTTVTAALADDTTMVFAPTLERAKAVAKLVKGDGQSLEGKDSKLVAKMPKDAFFYGSAIELDKINRSEGLFPVLRQHSFVMWSIGERDGKVFEELTLTANTEEVAEQMKNGVEGLVALGNVWAADSKAIKQLQENKPSIEREGNTVHAKWEGKSADVAAAIDEIKSRIERRME